MSGHFSTLRKKGLKITFLLNKYFFLQMAYELLSQSRKLNIQGGGGPNKGEEGGRVGKFFEKKNKREGRALIRNPRVT